ncbi:MAG TPA: hypothetical protein VFY62_05055 [Pseudomonas sp.]|nr:hypothetical protein [Pseudomonas sp.]
MKLSDGFDARRLRSGGSGRWRRRLGALLAALLVMLGLALLLTGGAVLLGRAPTLVALHESVAASTMVLVAGLFLLCCGGLFWRRCRRRAGSSDLNMAPHLLKKRN